MDPIVSALMGIRQYPTDDPIAGIQPPLQVPKPGRAPPPVNAAPNPNQVMSGVGDITGVNDAVRALRGQMTPEEQQGFAATAAFGLLPGAGELRPVAKAAEELAPPLYSAAAKAIQDARLTKGTPEQWLSALRSSPDVKQEELQYLNLDNLFKQHGATTQPTSLQVDAPTTARDALTSWKTNNPGQRPPDNLIGAASAENKAYLEAKGRAASATPQAPLIDKDEMQQWANANQVQLKEVNKSSDKLYSNFNDAYAADPRYGKDPRLNLPGGQNYREMLLTLPPNVTSEEDLTKAAQRVYPEFRESGRSFSDLLPEQQAQVRRDIQQDPRGTLGADTQFTSSHWDEPNVIAHARMNDRDVPDANGDPKKTLFLEELQSDWNQAGRKQGYVGGFDPKQFQINELPNKGGFDLVHRDTGTLIDNYKTKGEANAFIRNGQIPPNLSNVLGGVAPGTVPANPFESTWADLTLKRMVRHAAENGYDQLAWTPGDVQADRYDLSKQISEIHYSGSNLKAYDHNGNTVINTTGVRQQDLPNYIGKEAADKLLAQPVQQGTLRSLVGEDLKVGGEGMKAFYDKMLVDKANAIGKKYGARVEQRPMQTADRTITDPDLEGLEAEDPEQQAILDAHTKETPTTKKAWVLPITPELRQAALQKGFPMFAAGGLTALGTAGGQTGGSPPDENAQMLNALRGQVSQPTPPM